MLKQKVFLLVGFLLCSCSLAAAFSFSEYEAQDKSAEKQSASFAEPSLSSQCLQALKTKKLALIIAEREQREGFLFRQTRYSRFYERINRALEQLGVQTYSPTEITEQIARAEVKALLNNDVDAAARAADRLGADLFIRGIINTSSAVNPVLNIDEVSVLFEFSLTDSSGRLLASSALSGDSYSGSDIFTTLNRLVEENGSQVVRKLLGDYCASGRLKAESRSSGLVRSESTTPSPDRKTSPPKARHEPMVDKANPSVPEVKTIIVSAEGLADPEAETYKKDKGLIMDALRADARRQAIEKAVGTYVDSSTLVENFMLINDRVLTRSKGLIKRIIKETEPWLGKDGLMHIMIKAEVFLSDVREALQTISRNERISLIREAGDPTISVAVLLRDASRDSRIPAERSEIAENILKQEFKSFGYRVWSEEYARGLLKGEEKKRGRRIADFSVIGEAKFDRKSIRLPASGNVITRHILTSWTVKCINNHTGEEVYFNNKVPRKKSWDSEDAAVEDIGGMIGREFSADFFRDQLMAPSVRYQMVLTGTRPISYDTALLLKKEFIGLRPVLSVDLRDFSEGSRTVYEIECAGRGKNFSQILNNSILKPLNAKLGAGTLRLAAHHGNVVEVVFDMGVDEQAINEKLTTLPPASLAAAAPERVRQVIKDTGLLKEIEAVNPYMQKKKNPGSTERKGTAGMIENF